MGLAERKQMKKFDETYLPGLLEKLEDAVGRKVEVEIVKDTFDTVDSIRYLPDTCLRRATDALRNVCKDDLGREAIHESLEKLMVSNVPTPAEKKIEFNPSEKTLVLAGNWAGSGGYFAEQDIQKTIESAL